METQFLKNLNLTETGFHILSLLIRIDGRNVDEERAILDEFVSSSFGESIDLIKEQAFINALPEEEYDAHYAEALEHFYSISNSEQRHQLFNFAMQTCMADDEMHPTENRYIGMLMHNWDVAR